MISRLQTSTAFGLIILIGLFVGAQMGLYVVHEFWNFDLNWNIFQYCLSNLNEGGLTHSLVKITFNMLIAYTFARIFWTAGRQIYLSNKWNRKFEETKHVKWTKRLNYQYRGWNCPIVVLQDDRFVALVIGWFRPRIVISTGLLKMFKEEEIKSILLHERFHCTHYDPLKTLVSTVFHEGMKYVPVLKGLIQYYKTWTELLADRFVIQQMRSPYSLGAVLLKLSSMTKAQDRRAGVHFANVAINYRMLQVLEPNKKLRVPFLYLQEVILSFMVLALMAGVVVGGCS